jgi:hypothetical protein
MVLEHVDGCLRVRGDPLIKSIVSMGGGGRSRKFGTAAGYTAPALESSLSSKNSKNSKARKTRNSRNWRKAAPHIHQPRLRKRRMLLR